MGEIHWLATLVGALVPMFMGFVWYNPVVRECLDGLVRLYGGRHERRKHAGHLRNILHSCCSCSILYCDVYGLSQSGGTGIYTWSLSWRNACDLTGIPILVSNSLFQRNSATNILINVGYWIVTFGVMGGVIALLVPASV